MENELSALLQEYNDLGMAQVVDHDRFNMISIVHHSTVLEGSTLTEVETSVLLNDGLTPKGKPLEHTFMVSDHFNALKFIVDQANQKAPVSLELIQQTAAIVMKNTGSVYQTILGSVDASKGEFRKGNVTAGQSYFPNYDKVPQLMDDLVHSVHQKISQSLSLKEKIDFSFDFHFHMVSIHPFYDGNGRTSRLMMNFVQQYLGLPLSFVHSQSKADYIQALIDTRDRNDMEIFRDFMRSEFVAQLRNDIDQYKKVLHPKKNRGIRLGLL